MADNDLKNLLEDVFSDVASESETREVEEGSLLEAIVADLLEGEVVTGSGSTEPAISETPVPARTGPEPEDGDDGSLKGTIAPHFPFILLGLLLVPLLAGLVAPTLVKELDLSALYLAGCAIVLSIMVIQWRLNASSARALRESEERHTRLANIQTRLQEDLKELVETNTLLRERVRLYYTAHQVSHALSLIRRPEYLAQEAVNLVRDRFDLYYVGLFLVEESGQRLVLQANALSDRHGQIVEPDHQMLVQGHQLEAGGGSTVGQCVVNGQALITSSSGEDEGHELATWLPHTRSEMTLPLKSDGRVIGVLVLQSTQPRAFSQEDVNAFQMMADHLAATFDNARTIAELRPDIEMQEKHLLRAQVQHPGLTSGRAASFYERRQTGVAFISEKVLPDIEQAIAQKKLVVRTEKTNGTHQTALIAPITLRDEVIGTLGFLEEEGRQWSDDELALIEDVTAQVALAVENTRLFEQTQLALEETDALYRASRAIASADSVEDILRAIVGSLTSPRVEQCCLGIFESPGGKLSDDMVIVASWAAGSEPLWQVGDQLSMNRDFMGEYVGRDRSLILSDVTVEERLEPARRDALVAAGVRSMAVVPLVAAGGWIGILAVAASRSGAITERNLQPYLTLAGQAALSIERSSLFKQTQQALEETSMLYRASRAIGEATSILEVANVLLKSVAEAYFDAGLVLIRRQADNQLEVVAGWERTGRKVETGALLDASQIPLDLTIYSDATQPDGNFDCRALDQAPNLDTKIWQQWLGRREGQTLASVPIVFRGILHGALLVASRAGRGSGKSGDQISEKTLQPFVTLAAQAAVAIENRRLFEETRQAAEEEALLNKMLQNLATALDVPAIIEAVQDPLASLVSFDHIALALFNKETSTLEIFLPGVEQSGDGQAEAGGQVMSLQDSLIGQAITSRQTTVFDLNDPSLQGAEVETIRRMGLQSLLAVPVMYGREVLGVLSLAHSEPSAYTSVDRPLLGRVAQLTAIALENARLFSQLHQRAVQLETAAQVSQAATSILNLDHLLSEAVELIRDQFNLYYVGLFMVDEANEWAVLRAGTGEAGRVQLEGGHRLKVGGESMVGWCVANAQPRMALDVGEEAVRFQNPALPETRSELALPLISRGETIGAISVQSTRRAAFSSEDVTILQTMADQLANAIQNARLFEQNQQALAETETLYRASAELNTAQNYQDVLAILRQHTLVGQGAQNVSLNLFDRPWTGDHMPEWVEVLARWSELPAEAVSPRYQLSAFPSASQMLRPDAPTVIEDVAGDPRIDDNARALYQKRFGARSTIFVPLVVAGQWIGYINAIYQQPTIFPDAEVRRLMALSAQAAVVIQGIRQLQEIQARARREALIREITNKIRASTNLETILQTTVTEVSKALGTAHGAIRLGPGEPPAKRDGPGVSEPPPSRGAISSFTEAGGEESQVSARPDANSPDARPPQALQESTSPPQTGKGG
ncbi:MAG: hypothetical protein Kow0063_13140 [Anaerolineae bacterium]